MVDRRKRLPGQVWRLNFNTWLGPQYLRGGQNYVIIGTSEKHIDVVSVNNGESGSIPRKHLTTRNDMWRYVEDTTLVMKPYAMICAHCGDGDVIESYVRPTSFTCKGCSNSTSFN